MPLGVGIVIATRLGVTGTIVVCSGALALAGSPQLHELVPSQRPAARTSCGMQLRRASQSERTATDNNRTSHAQTAQ